MNKNDIAQMIEPLLNKRFVFFLDAGESTYKEYEVYLKLIDEKNDLKIQIISTDNEILGTTYLINNSRVFCKISISGSIILINDNIALTLK